MSGSCRELSVSQAFFFSQRGSRYGIFAENSRGESFFYSNSKIENRSEHRGIRILVYNLSINVRTINVMADWQGMQASSYEATTIAFPSRLTQIIFSSSPLNLCLMPTLESLADNLAPRRLP